MRGHVIQTLVVVLVEILSFGGELVELLLEIAAHGRRGIFLDEQRRRGGRQNSVSNPCEMSCLPTQSRTESVISVSPRRAGCARSTNMACRIWLEVSEVNRRPDGIVGWIHE